MYGKVRNRYVILEGNPERKDHFEDLDAETILKCTLKNLDIKV
jgi:hypothetical protein